MPAESVPAGRPPGPDRVTPGRPAATRPDRLVLVVGTGTEVGKTWVSAALLGSLAAAGHRVAARKPAQSFDPADPLTSTDAAVLARATGQRPEAVCPPERWYPVAMAPPMAAEVLGRPPFTVAHLAAEIGWGADGSAATSPPPDVGLVETAGGVRSPQADDGDAVDLGRLLQPDLVVLVADAGLGTINGVRLAVEALARMAAPVVVVLNRFDPADDLHRRNRAWLADREGLAVLVTPGGEGDLGRLALQCPAGGDAVDQVNGTDDRDGGGRHWGEVVTSTVEKPQAGDLVVSPELGVTAGPLVGSDESTPLEEDEPEGIVPPSPLWAMKMRRHIQWHLLPSHERHERVRDKVGSGDETVYVIDDGRHHVMVGRRVGGRAGEIEYALVGRSARDRYDDLLAGRLAPLRAFDGASGLTLCGIAAEEAILSSNLFDVDHYAELADVPPEYQPGSPYIEFTEDLDIPID